MKCATQALSLPQLDVTLLIAGSISLPQGDVTNPPEAHDAHHDQQAAKTELLDAP